MRFLCKKMSDPVTGKHESVNREDCHECSFYDDCLKDGYLDEVDKCFDVPPNISGRLQALAKMCQRALDPDYVPAEKRTAYSVRISGSTDAQNISLPEDKLRNIFAELNVSFDEGRAGKLKDIGWDYLHYKSIWNSKTSFGESKKTLKNIASLAGQLGNSLDVLQPDLRKLLDREFKGLEAVHSGAYLLRSTIQDILGKKIIKYYSDLPLIQIIQQLKPWYEEATGTPAFTTYNPYHDSCSPFVRFVYSCLEGIDPDSLPPSRKN